MIHSRLASDAGHEITTTDEEVAPDPTVWPTAKPVPFWPTRFTDAHLLRVAHIHGDPVWVVSFLDPATPAWFTIWVDRRSYDTLRLEMIATAHFMENVNGRFDAPVAVERPRAGKVTP